MYRFDSSLDKDIQDFTRKLLKRASVTAAERSEDGGVAQYGNYASTFKVSAVLIIVLTSVDVDVAANEIFGANVKRLEELKHKYDPGNVFRNGLRLTPRPLIVVN